ncbi:hypothetical protein [Caenimonas soli]|uniref:hypothetical protein n=1 Tax=Caenimonas soli TaxID=2735555 RepID=UPI001554C0A0|nr:hypothetical protein [Caenimonas soli]NPC57822.1 hypothetical protein [Caenimonas soli]
MRKKTRHKQQRDRKGQASQRGPFLARHPLNDVPFAQRREYTQEVASNARKTFDVVLPRVLSLVKKVDPLHALALIATHGLMASFDTRAEDKAKGWKPRIQQSHVEYLQSLFLRGPWLRGMTFPEPGEIQNLLDWLPDLFNASQQMRHIVQEVAANQEAEGASKIAGVQELLRSHTSAVRNWGYFGTVTRISKELFKRVNEPFKQIYGISLTSLITVFEGLVRRHEEKVNEHRKRLFDISREPTVDSMVTRFFAEFEPKGELADFRRELTAPGVGRREAAMRIWMVADRFLASGLIVNIEQLALETETEATALWIIFNQLSVGFGDLSDLNPEGLLLENPVWLRPMIYLDRSQYFCPLPQTLLSFIFPIVDELVAPHSKLQQKLSQARANFLEDEVSELFAKALPGATMHRGFKWREVDRQYENDLAVRFDTTLLLIECKSGRVSWPALRGAPVRLVEHVKTLIVEPSDQSGRLAERLKADVALVDGGQVPTLGFPLALEGITCVLRLSVTLHDFATLQSVPVLLEGAGALQNKYPLAPCLSLADLEVMLDLLDTACLRVHYLRRRAEMLMRLNAIGDELDMLGLYLDTSLNLGFIDLESSQLLTVGYSKKIDRYYTARDEGLIIPKPRPAASEWILRLCRQLQERGKEGWSEIACGLLSVQPKDQTNMERQLRALAKRLQEDKPLKGGLDSIALIPPEWMNQAVAFQVKRRDQAGSYGRDSVNVAQQAMQMDHVTRCVVFVVDALDPELKYLSAGLLYAQERQPGKAVFY